MATVRWEELRREPFRLFFPLGIAFGCFGVGHWLAYALGWRESYSGFYHASLQVGTYMSCFIVGFLLTALPRFSATDPASSWELAGVLGLVFAQASALWTRQWVAAEALSIGLLALVAVFAGRRFARKAATVRPPTEFLWIPLALLHGLIGTGLLILGQLGLAPSWWLGVGRPMAQQGFLLGMVVGVAGFMAPRLMGREALLITPPPAAGPAPAGRSKHPCTRCSLSPFRASSPIGVSSQPSAGAVGGGVTPDRARHIRRRRLWLHGIAGVAFFMSFWIEGAGLTAPAYLLRAVVVTAELLWTTRLHRPPAVSAGYVRLLWVSIWMVVLGLWGAGLAPRYRVAMLHLVFLGGFSLMTFAVGTMVVLSHAGEAQRLRQPLGVLRVVGLGLAGSLTARLIAEAQPARFFPWLGVAAICWMAGGISWLAFILPRVARPLAPGAFEQAHEEATRRLLKAGMTHVIAMPRALR